MAATQRKPFKYVRDTNPYDSPDEMDEEHQEDLINSFQANDETMNKIYVAAFTLMPLATIPGFLFFLLMPSSIPSVRLLCLMGITSLSSTAFTMCFVPFSSAAKKGEKVSTRRVPVLDLEIDNDGPLAKVLPYLNVSICLLLTISSWGIKGRRDIAEGFWVFLLFPAIMLGMVTVARRSIFEVEEGIEDLTKLKYNYKGA